MKGAVENQPFQEGLEFPVFSLQTLLKLFKKLKQAVEMRKLELVEELQEFSVSGFKFSVLKIKNQVVGFNEIASIKNKTMDTPSFKEDHISQKPALQMLVNLFCLNVINQNMHNKPNNFIVQKKHIYHGI